MSIPLAFASVVLIWSTTSLAVKWSLGGVSFWLAASLRMLIALGLCTLVMGAMRWRLPQSGPALRAYGYNGLAMFVGFAGTYWAAQYLSSGLLAVLWGLLPLISGVLAALLLRERFGRLQLAGVLLGLFGLWLVFAASVRLNAEAHLAVGVLIAVIVVHALCLVAGKRHARDLPAFALLSGGLAVTTALFAASWLLFDGTVPDSLPPRTLAAIVYLASIGSVAGMGAYFYLLMRVRTSQATLATLLPPVCALALGHWLNGEPLSPHAVSGAILIVSGMVLAQRPWVRPARA